MAHKHYPAKSLHWRHNGRDTVSNHQPHDCSFNNLFRRSSKKTSQLRVTGLCVGNSPGTGEFPTQMASDVENVSIFFWRNDTSQNSLSPEGLSDKPYDAHNECPGGIWRIRNTNNTCNSPFMMTSSNGNIFRVTGHLCGEFTDHRWISCTKASDAELWCLLWFAHE